MNDEFKAAVNELVDEYVGVPPAQVYCDKGSIHVCMDTAGLKEEWLELGEAIAEMADLKFNKKLELYSTGFKHVHLKEE